MRSDASIDEESLRRYVDWLAGQGVRGLAVNVDTGEGPHLFPEERLRVLEIVAEEVSGRALVVAGLAASFTEQARRIAADTARAGADALLVFPISAYQGEPLDPEIPASYHRAVAEASGLPLIAFQLQPALGGVNFSAEAIERIMGIDGVVAIKEASFDAKRFVETARLVEVPAVGPHRPERQRQLPARGVSPRGRGGTARLRHARRTRAGPAAPGRARARSAPCVRAPRHAPAPVRRDLRPARPRLPRPHQARAHAPGGHRRSPRPAAAAPAAKDACDLVDGALKEAGLR